MKDIKEYSLKKAKKIIIDKVSKELDKVDDDRINGYIFALDKDTDPVLEGCFNPQFMLNIFSDFTSDQPSHLRYLFVCHLFSNLWNIEQIRFEADSLTRKEKLQ